MTKLAELEKKVASLKNDHARERLGSLISKGMFNEALAYVIGSLDYIDWYEEEQRLERIKLLLL
ncbi:hypothetical protein vBValSX1_50 [Vibrio phage vB_ValS_X1]|uniref:Uncharacterized protein n=1 Tax=Vibrio phage vB_ValS_X1 TaxID=2736341 RepID=A0A6M9Z7L4_9CAUD|nr:hypothetical protein vBValSX1_50 [Vibrio phage vB_ValS_X1]